MNIGIGIGIGFAGWHGFNALQYGTVGAWLRADSIAAADLNAGNVASWSDRLALGTATQGVAADQPLYNSSSSNFNGRQSVTFDGASEYLIGDYAASAFSGNDTPWTIIMAVRSLGITNQDRYWGAGNSGLAAPFLESYQDATNHYAFTKRDDASTSKIAATTESISTTSTRIIAEVFDGTQLAMWINGTLTSLGNPSPGDLNVGATTLNRWTIAALRRNGAAANFGNVEYGEILIYKAAIADSPLSEIVDYMGDRYAVAVA